MADPSCTDCIAEEDLTVLTPPETQMESPKPYNPLDITTFVPPTTLPIPSVTVEFCDRCRWLHRATWVSTELLITFPSPTLKGVHIVPLNAEETAGRFRVWLSMENGPVLVWDRKVEGKFPELKELKRRIRDHIQPEKSLGHSDKHK